MYKCLDAIIPVPSQSRNVPKTSVSDLIYAICPGNNPFFKNESHSATCYLLFLLMLVLLLTALIPTTARTVAGDFASSTEAQDSTYSSGRGFRDTRC